MSLESDIKKIVQSVGLALYDITTVSEFDETIYRVSVVRPRESHESIGESVTLDECVELTNLISPLLDVEPPISGDYRLEVSSAGIERKLKKAEHFKLSIGELIKFTTKDGQKHRGELLRADDERFYVDIKGDESNFSYDELSKAKTYFQW